MRLRRAERNVASSDVGQQPLLAFPVDFSMLDLGSDQQWPARMLADRGEQARSEPSWAVAQHGSPRGVDPRPEAEESARCGSETGEGVGQSAVLPTQQADGER